jgi:cobalt-zinc-cadmium efflux system protein
MSAPHLHTEPHAPRGTIEHDRRALVSALLITLSYLGAEIVGGVWTGSLALLSDAAHMFTDVVALGLGLFGVWIAARPATTTKTYGYYRAEILAAFLNGIGLWLVVLIIVWQAWQRFLDPPVVSGFGVLVVAAVGLVVNVAAARMLYGAASHNLNVRGAFLHVLSDMLGSIGVLVSSTVILLTGWMRADAVASALIAVLVLFSSWTLIREAVDILMEAVPRHIDLDDLKRTLEDVPGATEVHDLHVWSLTTGHYALSAHAVVQDANEREHVLGQMTEHLATRFGITHVTIQLEAAERRISEPAHPAH